MIIVLGDTGRKMHHDVALLKAVAFFAQFDQVAELAQQRPAAAAAAGEGQHPVIALLGVGGKSSAAVMESFFAMKAGAALADDMTLYDDNVLLIFDVGHFLISFRKAERSFRE